MVLRADEWGPMEEKGAWLAPAAGYRLQLEHQHAISTLPATEPCVARTSTIFTVQPAHPPAGTSGSGGVMQRLSRARGLLMSGLAAHSRPSVSRLQRKTRGADWVGCMGEIGMPSRQPAAGSHHGTQQTGERENVASGTKGCSHQPWQCNAALRCQSLRRPPEVQQRERWRLPLRQGLEVHPARQQAVHHAITGTPRAPLRHAAAGCRQAQQQK